jgi:pimeloyl-ACP methyl ester carboxylesterase/quercetin dioxygenase-like cupin family protein
MNSRDVAWTLGTLALVGCASLKKEQTMETKHRESPVRMQTFVQGAEPPIVLVGGGLTGALSWEPHQARLARSRRVARVQPLSVQYGLENRPLPDGYSVEMESAALGAAIDDLGSAVADVVAWSYGAAIALEWALDHPERVRTLALIEPPALWVLGATGLEDETSRRASAELRALYATMTNDVTEDQLAAFALQAGLCPPGTSPRDLPAWPVWVRHRRSLRTGGALWAHTNTVERLRAFDRPVLIVKGTGSAPFLHRITDGLASALPRGEILELPGGHAPQIVAMDNFLSRLAAFHAGRAARTIGLAEADVKWAAHAAVPGARRAILEGDLRGPGLVTMRVELPAGASIAPVTHPTDERFMVLSGSLRFGLGDKVDRERARRFGPSAFVVAPAGVPHYLWTDEGTVIHMTVETPWEFHFVNPGDAPPVAGTGR